MVGGRGWEEEWRLEGWLETDGGADQGEEGEMKQSVIMGKSLGYMQWEAFLERRRNSQIESAWRIVWILNAYLTYICIAPLVLPQHIPYQSRFQSSI